MGSKNAKPLAETARAVVARKKVLENHHPPSSVISEVMPKKSDGHDSIESKNQISSSKNLNTVESNDLLYKSKSLNKNLGSEMNEDILNEMKKWSVQKIETQSVKSVK